MSVPEACRLDALELARRVSAREQPAEEIVAAFLGRVRETDGLLHAFLDLDEADVLSQARGVDARVRSGEDLPLAGVPVALKDNLCALDRPTSAGSRMLAGWRAPYDATVVARLRAAGAIAFGKTNCDEFAMGSSTEHSAFGPTRNPWDPERVPGGSSGGSAVAVAAFQSTLSLGSDTGGSIRQPAALCGIVGVKPTYGRVSRHGLVAFASSLDQVGPLARSVREAALLLGVIGGPDPLDSTCSHDEMPCLHELALPGSFRFGVPTDAPAAGLHPAVRLRFEEGLKALEAAGGERVDVSLPHAEPAVATYYVVAAAEASSNLARFDGVRLGHRAQSMPSGSASAMIARSRGEGFGDEVQRRILLGTHVLSAGYHDAYYRRASRVRSLIAQDFERCFAACDVVVTPSAPSPAFLLGEKLGDPLAMYLSDVYTVPASLAGLPGISLPCGLADGLPVGLQLVGPRLAEPRLLGIAALAEGILAFASSHALAH